MTRDQKLDQILRMLKWRLYRKHKGDESVKRMNIDLIMTSSGVESDDAEVKYLIGILEGDGNIEPDGKEIENSYSITRKGERFFDTVGGYEKQRLEFENKRIIDELTIKSLGRSKWALRLSITAIIISILSFLYEVFGQH